MNSITYTHREQQADRLAGLVGGQLQTALQQNGVAKLAVPGGTTPAPFMQALAHADLDWSHVHVTLTDERQVPADNARSNAKLLRENFLEQGAEAQFHGLFDGDSGNLPAVSRDVQQSCLPLDVCVLGMGVDGHFASLFPEAEQLMQGLDPTNPDVVLAITAHNIPEPRLSLSLGAILSATHIHLLITGTAKKQVLEQAQAELARWDITRQPALPIQALLHYAQEKLTIHYAD